MGQEEITRSQSFIASKCQSIAQAGVLSAPNPNHRTQLGWIDASPRPPHFRALANRNSNCSASQRPALLPAFCVLPWRRDGRIQTQRGIRHALPKTAPACSTLLPCFTPGLAQWTCLEGLEPQTRALAGALHCVGGFFSSIVLVSGSGSGSFRVYEFGFVSC